MEEKQEQTLINKTVSEANTDTPENRIKKLEEEVNLIKGSIKKLLIDIRETMNNLENPFQSLQTMAAVAAVSQPKIKPVEIVPPEEKKEEEGADKDKESKEEDVKIEDIFEGVEEIKKPRIDDHQKIKEKNSISSIEIMDFITLYKIMEWTNEMISKYGEKNFNDIVEIFYLLGFITKDIKEIVSKIASFLSDYKNRNIIIPIKEVVVDMYKFYSIVNPHDKSKDSEVLKLILDKEV